VPEKKSTTREYTHTFKKKERGGLISGKKGEQFEKFPQTTKRKGRTKNRERNRPERARKRGEAWGNS